MNPITKFISVSRHIAYVILITCVKLGTNPALSLTSRLLLPSDVTTVCGFGYIIVCCIVCLLVEDVQHCASFDLCFYVFFLCHFYFVHLSVRSTGGDLLS